VRTIGGFLVAPLGGLIAACLFVLPWIGELGGLGSYLVVGIIYAYPSAILIGLPLYLLTKRAIGHLRFWHFVVGGIATALPGLYFVLAPENVPYFQRTWLLNTFLCVVTGAVAGVVLWLFLKEHRSRGAGVL
jgi:hypothetical protein